MTVYPNSLHLSLGKKITELFIHAGQNPRHWGFTEKGDIALFLKSLSLVEETEDNNYVLIRAVTEHFIYITTYEYV